MFRQPAYLPFPRSELYHLHSQKPPLCFRFSFFHWDFLASLLVLFSGLSRQDTKISQQVAYQTTLDISTVSRSAGRKEEVEVEGETFQFTFLSAAEFLLFPIRQSLGRNNGQNPRTSNKSHTTDNKETLQHSQRHRWWRRTKVL